jgi:hypothetical protein
MAVISISPKYTLDQIKLMVRLVDSNINREDLIYLFDILKSDREPSEQAEDPWAGLPADPDYIPPVHQNKTESPEPGYDTVESINSSIKVTSEKIDN